MEQTKEEKEVDESAQVEDGNAGDDVQDEPEIDAA